MAETGTDDSVKSITIDAKHRRARVFSWLEKIAEGVKNTAIQKRRKDKRADGSKLSPGELVKVADELEKIQRELNPLLVRHQELSRQLVAHWAHTGIEEIEGTLGKTRISISLSLAVNQRRLRQLVSERKWRSITEPVLNIPLLLSGAQSDMALREDLESALTAVGVKISVVPPSSRRAKSGELAQEE